MDHLKALSALRGIKQNLSLTLASKLDDGETEVTFIRPKTEDGSLSSMLAGYARWDCGKCFAAFASGVYWRLDGRLTQIVRWVLGLRHGFCRA
jgi:hypothetical protein